ncbi:MAG: saccharopine dehydrogenase NADP-binding domain-containing protein [Myxococcota bacterium]|nr:saccharopine dehydrogenase NADP-binding domain-containing protein [Myxococcota bacterium]
MQSSKQSRVVVYGATGFTGRLVIDELIRAGIEPVLAARDARRLRTLRAELALESFACRVEEVGRMRRLLRAGDVVLSAAGPFRETALPLAEACLGAGAHYLDLSGEARATAEVSRLHDRATRRGTMLLPGVGFDVVPSDCLAAHVSRKAPGAEWLRIGISGLDQVSRGSALTISRQLGRKVDVRRSGHLTSVVAGTLWHSFDFGSGARPSTAVSWADVVTAWYTTAVPNVTVYFDASPAVAATMLASGWIGDLAQAPPWRHFVDFHLPTLEEGPDAERRARARAVIVCEAGRGSTCLARARLESPGAYDVSAASAARIARRVSEGDFEAGFQTPGRLFGADFALSLPGVARTDLAA